LTAFDAPWRTVLPTDDDSSSMSSRTASVLLAWYQFYLNGNKTSGLFIGLWPPTILAFSSYLNQKAILKKLDQSLLSSTGSLDSLRKMITE